MKLLHFLIISSSILLGGCWVFDESQFVLMTPQYVISNSMSTGSIDLFKVDGKVLNFEARSVKVGPGGARKNLAGVDGFGISISSVDHKTLRVSATIPPNNDGEKITVDSLNLWVDSPSDHLSSIPPQYYSTTLYVTCPKNNGFVYHGSGEYFSIPLIPRGPIILEQRTKHITLKGTFDIPPTAIPRDPYMICETEVDEKGFYKKPYPTPHRNPAPPAIIEVRGIHLDIDTDLTFRWCSKGAKCYEK